MTDLSPSQDSSSTGRRCSLPGACPTSGYREPPPALQSWGDGSLPHLPPGPLRVRPGSPWPGHLGKHQGSTQGQQTQDTSLWGRLPASLPRVRPCRTQKPSLLLSIPFPLLPAPNSAQERFNGAQEGVHFRGGMGTGGCWGTKTLSSWGAPCWGFCSLGPEGLTSNGSQELLPPPCPASLFQEGPHHCSGAHWATTPVSQFYPPPSLGAPTLSPPEQGAFPAFSEVGAQLVLNTMWGVGGHLAFPGGFRTRLGCPRFGQSLLDSGVSCASARVLWC